MEFLRCRRTSSVKAMTETQNADVNQENESLNLVLSSSTLTGSSDDIDREFVTSEKIREF